MSQKNSNKRRRSTNSSNSCPAQTGYFTRSPDTWNLEDFVHESNDREPRKLAGRWGRILGKIAQCSRPGCCDEDRRNRARQLLASPKPIENIHAILGNMNNTIAIVNASFNGSVQVTNSPSSPKGCIHDERDDADEISNDESSEVTFDSQFEASYLSFAKDSRWKLSSGRIVEEILYSAHHDPEVPPSVKGLLASWIVDVRSQWLKNRFFEKEWSEIISHVPALPVLDENFTNTILRFENATSIERLKEAINTAFLAPDVSYTKEQTSNAEWADHVARSFCFLYESKNKPLQNQSALERTIDMLVWSPILDYGFLLLDGAILERSESTCVSSQLRKNRNRSASSARMKSGPRLDGILRSSSDRSHEFCAIEAARTESGGFVSTKSLKDSVKLTKVLRDMLGRLCEAANYDRQIVEKLNVVGISTSGLKMQVSRMCQPKGYVCLFTKEVPREVPSKVEQFRELILLLASLTTVKHLLLDTITAFNGRYQGGSGGSKLTLQQELEKLSNP